MNIRQANLLDLPRINFLIQSYSLAPIDANFINDKDMSIVAEKDNKIVGFVWGGVMANQSLVFIDYLTVDGMYANTNIGHKMVNALLKIGKERGSRIAITNVLMNKFYYRSKGIAERVGMIKVPHKCALLLGDINQMYNKMEKL